LALVVLHRYQAQIQYLTLLHLLVVAVVLNLVATMLTQVVLVAEEQALTHHQIMLERLVHRVKVTLVALVVFFLEQLVEAEAEAEHLPLVQIKIVEQARQVLVEQEQNGLLVLAFSTQEAVVEAALQAAQVVQAVEQMVQVLELAPPLLVLPTKVVEEVVVTKHLPIATEVLAVLA